ncbi:MAG: FHA domain-containing protein, partial [Alphaproteobacteria bacterium]
GSSNGTFVNDKPVKPNSGQKLRDGDRLAIADAVFQVKLS